MSIPIAENDFKAIFGTISVISRFLNSADADNLEVDLIKNVLGKAYYVERLVEGLKKRELADTFETKLNEFLKTEGKIITLSANQLVILCDDVLNKIFTLRPPLALVSYAIEEYISLLKLKRFQTLVERLSQFRSLFLQLSNDTQCHVAEYEIGSSFLAQSWVKLIDTGEDGRREVETILKEMLSDVDSFLTITAILRLESDTNVSSIHGILLNTIHAELKQNPCLPTWIRVLKDNDFVNIIEKFPEIFNLVEITLSTMEECFYYDCESKSWLPTSVRYICYPDLMNVIITLWKSEVTHYRVKKLINRRKHKLFWEHISKEIIQTISDI